LARSSVMLNRYFPCLITNTNMPWNSWIRKRISMKKYPLMYVGILLLGHALYT
jgi:hypothetical protein